jgi:hypothetical protein
MVNAVTASSAGVKVNGGPAVTITLVIPNKLTEAISKGSFRRADQTTHEPAGESRAEAAGVHAPPMSEPMAHGLAVEAALAAGKFEDRLELQQRYEREKGEYEAARDAAVWARVTARRNVKL